MATALIVQQLAMLLLAIAVGGHGAHVTIDYVLANKVHGVGVIPLLHESVDEHDDAKTLVPRVQDELHNAERFKQIAQEVHHHHFADANGAPSLEKFTEELKGQLHSQDKSLANLDLFLVVPATAEKHEPHLEPLKGEAIVLNTAAGLLGGSDKLVHLVIVLKAQAEREKGHKAVLARLAEARVGGNNAEGGEQLAASIGAEEWEHVQLYNAFPYPDEGPLVVVSLGKQLIFSGNVKGTAMFVFHNGLKQLEIATPRIAEQICAAQKATRTPLKVEDIEQELKKELEGLKRKLEKKLKENEQESGTKLLLEGHFADKRENLDIYVVVPGAGEETPHSLVKLPHQNDVVEEARKHLPENSEVGLVYTLYNVSKDKLVEAFNKQKNNNLPEP